MKNYAGTAKIMQIVMNLACVPTYSSDGRFQSVTPRRAEGLQFYAK